MKLPCIFLMITGLLICACDRSERSQPPSAAQADVVTQQRDAVRTAVTQQAERLELEPAQTEQLGRQMSEIAHTNLAGSIERYDEMVGSWGGRFLYDFNDPSPVVQESIQQQRQSWQDPGSDYAIKYFDASRLVLEVTQGTPGTARTGTLPMGGARIAPSRYRFNKTTKELDDGVNPVATLTVPVILNNGQENTITYVFIWSRDQQVWVPDHLRVTGPEPRPPFYF